jgi:predicted RNase H-like HicB family nuclease
MHVYPAILFAREGGYAVSIPDLPACRPVGSTQHDAVRNALATMALHLDGLSASGAKIPQPSSLDALPREPQPGEVARLLLPAEIVGRVVRLNISMDEGVVAMADRRAAALGMTRSGYIAHLVRGDQSKQNRAARQQR